MLTPFSLTGFWTDIIFALILVVFSLYWLFKHKIENKVVRLLFNITTIISSFLVLVLIVIYAINPYSWTVLQTKFIESKTNGNFIELNYFRPTGAWGCGYGTYWESKTLKYFPLIEHITHENDCTQDDWGYYIKTGKWE